ncbi:MAG: HPP family protein [Myxococcales bacterium]
MSLARVDAPSRRVLLSSVGAGLFILSLAAVDLVLRGAVPLSALIPPFGASTVIVFFSPESPAGRPWNVTAGHLGSALVAISAMTLIPNSPVAVQAALAVSGAGIWMVLSRSIHPPGGATALLATLGGPKLSALAFCACLLTGCFTLCSVRWLVDFGVRISERSVPRSATDAGPHA